MYNKSHRIGGIRVLSGKARVGLLSFLQVLVGWLALLLMPVAAQAAANSLQDVSFAALPGGAVQIILTLESPPARPSSFTIDTPARIVLDFPQTQSALSNKTRPIGVGMVQSLTALEAGGLTRVVVNLVSPVSHSLEVQGREVIVTVQESQTTTAARAKNRGAATVTPEPAAAAPAGEGIENIDFRRGPDGQGLVVVTLSDPSTVVDVRERGTKVQVDFLDTRIPSQLMQRLDVTDFATPVTLVETRPSGRNVRMEISAAGTYDYMAYQAEDVFTVEFRALSKQEQEALKKDKDVYTGERLSLNFQDIEVRAVLQLLADFTGLNLVTSDTVSGTVTLRLKNVPWDQALDIILKTKGLSARQTGNVMLVAPTEEIAAREKLELESQQQIEELAPLKSEYIQINYAKASDLAELLKSEDNPLLTPERGNVSFDERTNTLLVQDTAGKLEEIRRLIEALDIPIRQVLIESRVVIATNDFAKDLGVRFGFNRGNTWSDNHFAVFAGGQPGQTSGTAGLAPGIENPDGSGAEALLVNLPKTLGDERGGAFNFIVGKLGSWLLQLELSAMQREGKGEIISSPKVITSDQNKATIKQGLEIPYQSSSLNTGTNVQFKDAVLQLDVTPHITPDDRIIMDLAINKDTADFSRSVLGQPPIDTRSVDTTVLVDNGETVVLGGVFERQKTQNEEKIPFFGDLPYVGFLFKSTFEEDTNRELLFFITPRILKETLGVR